MAGLQVLLLLTLIITVHTQRWPVNGDCQPCRCYYKVTSFGRVRHVNCSQRGLQSIPLGLPDDLMTLDLSWNPLDLDKLRKRLCGFRSLSSLSLSFTELTTLSNIFQGCTSLLEVNLTGNRLTQLDFSTFQGLENLRRLLGLEAKSVLDKDVFQSLTNLKDLDLIFHGESLPKGLFNNLMIKSINLVLTKAESLPEGLFEFGGKTLNALQLVGEQVKEVSSDLFNGLAVLKQLFLVLPQVQRMPESLFLIQQVNLSVTRVANLQEVEITGVRSFPASLLRPLDNLESLQFKDIGSFPEKAFLSSLVNLKTLIISGGKITTIPSGWFKNLYSLKTLKISNAQLEELEDDAFEGPISLNYLDLSFNKLKNVSARNLKPLNQTLETLVLAGNMLTELSKKNTENITMLRYLDLSENHISAVYADAFEGMTRLSVLYLSYNQISSLPINLFTDQFQLESLSLTNNYLSEFPVALLTLKNSLINLDLSFNEITQIPAAQLCQFVFLEKVNVMENPLHCDCHIMGFQKCPTILPEGICQTPREFAAQNIKDIKVSNSCKFTIEPKASEKDVISQEQNYVSTDGKKIPTNSHQETQQKDNVQETTQGGEKSAITSVATTLKPGENTALTMGENASNTLPVTASHLLKSSLEQHSEESLPETAEQKNTKMSQLKTIPEAVQQLFKEQSENPPGNFVTQQTPPAIPRSAQSYNAKKDKQISLDKSGSVAQRAFTDDAVSSKVAKHITTKSEALASQLKSGSNISYSSDTPRPNPTDSSFISGSSSLSRKQMLSTDRKLSNAKTRTNEKTKATASNAHTKMEESYKMDSSGFATINDDEQTHMSSGIGESAAGTKIASDNSEAATLASSDLLPTLNSAQNSKTEPRLTADGNVIDSVADAVEDNRLNINVNVSSKKMKYLDHAAPQNISFSKNVSGNEMNYLGHATAQTLSSSATALLKTEQNTKKEIRKSQAVKPDSASSESVSENDSHENTNRPFKQVKSSETVLRSSSNSSNQAVGDNRNTPTFNSTHKVNTNKRKPLFGEKLNQISNEKAIYNRTDLSQESSPIQNSMSKGHQNLPTHNQTKLPDIEPTTPNIISQENGAGQINNQSKSQISDTKFRNGTDVDQVASANEAKLNVENSIRSDVKNVKLVQIAATAEEPNQVPLLDSFQTRKNSKKQTTWPLQANVTIVENSTDIPRTISSPSQTNALTSASESFEEEISPRSDQKNIKDWSRKDILVSNTTLNRSALLSTVDNTANSEDRKPLAKKIVTDGEKDNKSKTSESVAFNFTIGAISAILVFGAVVLAVYGARRFRRQGSYTVSSDSYGEEAMELERSPTPLQFPSSRHSFNDFTQARPRPV